MMNRRSSQNQWRQADGGRSRSRVIQLGVGYGHIRVDRRVGEDIVLPAIVGHGVIGDSVAGANGGLAGLERIPSKTNARSEVSFSAVANFVAERRVLASGDHAVEGIAGAGDLVARSRIDLWG